MQMGNQRRWVLAPLLMPFVLLAVVLLPLFDEMGGRVLAQPGSPTGFAPPAESLSCLADLPVYYYADRPDKVSQDAFGPSAMGKDPSAVFGELRYRLCGSEPLGVGGDQALFTAIMSRVQGSDPNRELSRSQWESELQQFLGSVRLDTFRVTQDTPSYGERTLEMVSRPGRPLIGGVIPEQEPNAYLVFDVETENGTVTLELALDCGFQPRFDSPAGLPVALQ